VAHGIAWHTANWEEGTRQTKHTANCYEKAHGKLLSEGTRRRKAHGKLRGEGARQTLNPRQTAFLPHPGLRRRWVAVRRFSFPCVQRQHTAKVSPWVLVDAHGIGSSPWRSLPCLVCREQTHGAIFAVCFCYFAVCPVHTA
jgi:hypothetical protein